MRRVALALLLALLLAGCARNRWLEVASGEYSQVRGTDEASRAVARHVRGLRVDREAGTATLTLDDGSRIALAFVARERAEWPTGCPTNLVTHRMEVLDFEGSQVTVGSMTFQEPVLVRNCPEQPVEIVLREDGPMGGSGSARSDSSLVFSQASSTEPEATILGQWESVGYTFLRGQEGSSLMFWYDSPGAAHCDSSSDSQHYHATCSAQFPSGQTVDWEVAGSGAQVDVTIEGTSYGPNDGRLFLITIRDGATRVLQLDRDLSAVGPEEEDIKSFAETVPEILQLVRQASTLEDASPPSLPHSEKGYELYSWREGEGAGWYYTLVTGTNRLKSSEEIADGEDTVTEDGWVKLTVTDVDRLLELLGRLPAGEQIFWHRASATPTETEAAQFGLPGETVVNAVEARSKDLGLELVVAASELSAVLTIADTVAAGAAVELTFTLINQAAYPLYVLEWYTPLEGIAGEIFRVARDGQPLPYLGILAMRGDPEPENYVLLPSGGAETATVDLAQAYDFSEQGTYTIAFLSPRISHVARGEDDMARSVDELGQVTIVSNTVSVRVVTGER